MVIGKISEVAGSSTQGTDRAETWLSDRLRRLPKSRREGIPDGSRLALRLLKPSGCFSWPFVPGTFLSAWHMPGVYWL
jgi:hypothetical protein